MDRRIVALLLILMLFSTPAYAERFFAVEDNTWYNEIPVGASTISTSADIISFMSTYYTNILGYNQLHPDSWSPTLFRAEVGDPTTGIFIDYCHPDVKATQCDAIPLPAEARPSRNDFRCAGSYTDGHMIIINSANTYSWEFYQAAYCEDISAPGGDDDHICDGGETCEWRFGGSGFVRRWDLGTDGVNQPYDGRWSARVAKVPLLHGLVTYKEVVTDGVIDHAIAF